MRLRTKFLLFVITIHLVTLVLSYFVFTDDKIVFIVSEVFILLSALFAWQLYKQLIQPLRMITAGIEAMKDRDFTSKFVATGKREMDELISVYNKMIDALRFERTKQEQQHFFLEKLIHTSPTGIIILDYDNKIQQVNPKALQLLATTEKLLINTSIDLVDHPVIKQIVQLQTGEAKTITVDGVTTYKIQKSQFIDRGFPRVFIMIEELTIEILQAEKKAYGKIIRMMAHEVNNTIGPVNSIIHSTLKTTALANHSTLTNALEVAHERNQNLSSFMRNFADIVRLPQPNKKELDLHMLLKRIVTLMDLKAVEKDIVFTLKLSQEPIIIQADEQQLEQVLINVVKNAIEAIDSNGQITITTQALPKQLIISDTGKGIDTVVQEQLFSPFFSTKKDGQGVGLMLTREILMNHGYRFSLKSVVKGRTDFTINF